MWPGNTNYNTISYLKKDVTMKLYWTIYYKIFKPITRTDKLIRLCRINGVSYSKLKDELESSKTNVEVDFHVFYEKALQSKLYLSRKDDYIIKYDNKGDKLEGPSVEDLKIARDRVAAKVRDLQSKLT